MKPCTVGLAACVVAVAPVAQGQVTCADIETLNKAAVGGFAPMLGAPVAGGSDLKPHETRFALPGASACVIETPSEATYRCTWRFGAEAEVLHAYQIQSAAVAPCLAAWTPSALKVDDPSQAGVRVLAGVGYLGTGEYEDEVWSILAEFDPGGGASMYRLSIQLSHYPPA